MYGKYGKQYFLKLNLYLSFPLEGDLSQRNQPHHHYHQKLQVQERPLDLFLVQHDAVLGLTFGMLLKLMPLVPGFDCAPSFQHCLSQTSTFDYLQVMLTWQLIDTLGNLQSQEADNEDPMYDNSEDYPTILMMRFPSLFPLFLMILGNI